MRWRLGRGGSSLLLGTVLWVAMNLNAEEGSLFKTRLEVRVGVFAVCMIVAAAVVYTLFVDRE